MNMKPMSAPAPAARPESFTSALLATIRHRGVQTAAALWALAVVLALWLAKGSLPFDRRSAGARSG